MDERRSGNDASDAPAWLTDDEPSPGRSRVRVLWMAALVPWLVVATLALRGGTPEPSPPLAPPATAEPTEGPSVATAVGTPATTNRPSAPTDPPASFVISRGQGRTEVTVADATALATLLARDHLGGLVPRVGGEASTSSTYVDLVSPEAIDFPAPGHIVVTVLAVVLHAEGSAYTRAEVVRLAVPLTMSATGVRSAGMPWRLRPPQLDAGDAAVFAPVDDPDLLLQAVAALQAAGYEVVEVHGLERSNGWPWRVRATAVAPGSTAEEEQLIWLRIHQRTFVVAGALPPHRETSPEPRADGAAADEETP